jgi:hypothetical protein
MLDWLRRRRLPAQRRPPLEPDERLVTWGSVPGDGVIAVTTHGIWLPAAGRLGWHEIHKATWSGRQLALVASREVAATEGEVAAAAGEVGAAVGYTVVADEPPVVHMLLDPGNVPLQVRARVTKSIAYTQAHPLPGGGGVRVVARRVPGVDGLRWTVRYDDGTDPADDGIRAATADLVRYGKSSVEGAVP